MLGNLSKQDTELVGDIRDSVVTGLLTPVAQLGRDMSLLFGRGLVCANAVVLGLDEGVQLLRQVGLVNTTQRGHREPVLGGGRLAGISPGVLLRPD